MLDRLYRRWMAIPDDIEKLMSLFMASLLILFWLLILYGLAYGTIELVRLVVTGKG